MISLFRMKLLAMATMVAMSCPESKVRRAKPVKDSRKRHDMDDETACANHGEQNKADRKGAGGRVMNDEAKEVDADQRRQFELASVALAEPIRDFDNLQFAAGRKNHVDQDLETVGRKTRRQTRDDLAPDHEEAAHRIGDGRPRDSPEEPGAHVAQPLPGRREVSAPASLIRVPIARLAAPLASAWCIAPEDRLVVLKIAVDDRDEIRARRHPSLDDRARKTRAVDASQAAETAIFGRERKSDIRGPVGGIVIDDDHLPWQALESGFDALEKNGDVGRFLIGRDDDRKCRKSAPRAPHRSPFPATLVSLGADERYLPVAPG